MKIIFWAIAKLVKIFWVVQEEFKLNVHKYEQIILTICTSVILGTGALIFGTSP
ncbi:MAG: hypothetical protein O4808_19315 [Trichodesmium sp. St17_bin3_1_1]|nr:hypothetical protein [Trichodesmium sp. St17_bin3_1_1]MDE5123736.1 hypothetical protein [Trichodesmium sp. St19_bin1]